MKEKEGNYFTSQYIKIPIPNVIRDVFFASLKVTYIFNILKCDYNLI